MECYKCIHASHCPNHIRQEARGIMEQWIKDAKELAKSEAEAFVENMKYIASANNLEEVWFIEEVVKNIHNIKENNE